MIYETELIQIYLVYHLSNVWNIGKYMKNYSCQTKQVSKCEEWCGLDTLVFSYISLKVYLRILVQKDAGLHYFSWKSIEFAKSINNRNWTKSLRKINGKVTIVEIDNIVFNFVLCDWCNLKEKENESIDYFPWGLFCHS